MNSQIIVFIVIAVTLFLFIYGKLRYDFVALLGLVILTTTGVVSPEQAFLGFSHPAVITVASVLVISSALIKTGAIDRLVTLINRGPDKIYMKIMSLMVITAILSAFMNNVGALALILPIGITIARDNDVPPSQLLMPVAFASLLGGMMTGIGTPPNLIISTYRIQAGGEAFSFFSFAPVGVTLTILGILFTVFIGWRLIPRRDSDKIKDIFNLEDYLFELVVTDGCKVGGMTLKEFHKEYKVSINVLSIVRKNSRIISPGGNQKMLPGDILIVKAVSKNLKDIVSKTCLQLKGAKTDKLVSEGLLKSDDIALVEVVLRDDSPLVGRTAFETRLRNQYNANLIAVSRKGVSNINRLKYFEFNRGDVLLLQVPKASLSYTYSKMRCLPLAERGVDINIEASMKDQYLTLGIFVLSILASTFEIFPVQISFSFAALLLVILNVVSPREFYEAIEWPTIIMIGSLFSLGAALQSSGASNTIANGLMVMSNVLTPPFMLGLLMVMSMILTNLISSTATTILMGPIAISLAVSMGVSIDPLLMAVGVGASSAFLTPIAHQSNMLVMGPGGYRFTDYWHLGLPLSIISLVVGVPAILFVWPL
ncbi:MAG TPA: SLC13 family permease [Tissierellaceae bacterium]|nr:SLC13 family permease [Tissierellaceae bacterium]